MMRLISVYIAVDKVFSERSLDLHEVRIHLERIRQALVDTLENTESLERSLALREEHIRLENTPWVV